MGGLLVRDLAASECCRVVFRVADGLNGRNRSGDFGRLADADKNGQQGKGGGANEDQRIDRHTNPGVGSIGCAIHQERHQGTPNHKANQ